MKCFYHIQAEAVARCKNCHKGLCNECAVDVENGIACKDRCEDEVRAINAVMEENKSAHLKFSGNQLKNAALSALGGAVSLLIGLVVASSNPLLTLFFIAMGIVGFLNAALHYSSGRKFLVK